MVETMADLRRLPFTKISAISPPQAVRPFLSSKSSNVLQQTQVFLICLYNTIMGVSNWDTFAESICFPQLKSLCKTPSSATLDLQKTIKNTINGVPNMLRGFFFPKIIFNVPCLFESVWEVLKQGSKNLHSWFQFFVVTAFPE